MSSRFAATLMGWPMGHQNALGIRGNEGDVLVLPEHRDLPSRMFRVLDELIGEVWGDQ